MKLQVSVTTILVISLTQGKNDYKTTIKSLSKRKNAP